MILDIEDVSKELKKFKFVFPRDVHFFGKECGDQSMGGFLNSLVKLGAKNKEILHIQSQKDFFAFKHLGNTYMACSPYQEKSKFFDIMAELKDSGFIKNIKKSTFEDIFQL